VSFSEEWLWTSCIWAGLRSGCYGRSERFRQAVLLGNSLPYRINALSNTISAVFS